MSMEMIGGWALATYGKAFLDAAAEIITRKTKDKKEQSEKLQALERRWQNFNWDDAAERYKKQMQEIYGHIRVIGTTEPIPIGDIFTDVYILDKPQAYKRFDMMKLHEIQAEPEKLGSGKQERGLSIVVNKKRGHRLYILGKPGAGKTTFMKYLVNQTIIANELNKLPIFVTLRDWNARETNILDFIAKEFDTCNFPDAKSFIKYLLESGRAIVLFDGLDEVPKENEQRDKTIQAMHDFSKKYLKTQIVITCRVAASDYSFTEFTYIEMADFSQRQVNAYTQNWFRKEPKSAIEFLKELKLEENKSVRDIGSSPLLLSMICLAYEETLTIPKRRVELYEDALDALLKKWDSSRKIRRGQNDISFYKNLSLGRKKQLFARIAAEYFEKGEIFFKKKEVAKKIELFLKSLPPDTESDSPDGEAILEIISAQHGILVERAKGIYSFSHLTFQEYYTAKYITDNAIGGTLERLSKHSNDRRWREVFLLTASLLHEASPLFTALQKNAQKILENDSYALQMQSWTIEKAGRAIDYKKSGMRSLYWFIPLNYALGFNFDYPLDIANTLDILLAHAIARDIDAVPLARSYARYDYIDRARALNLAVNLTDGYDLAYDLDSVRVRNLTRDSALQDAAHKDLVFFEKSINKTNLLLITHLFTFLQKKEHSKKRKEKLQIILHNHGISLKPPSHSASKQAWQKFNRNIHNQTENFLGLNLDKLEKMDYRIALRYLVANQLFFDCLQVATVEDREAIEDMILNMPKENSVG
ncbi:MAG: NACHT domain-containing protein [Anaerolineae bacterium]|jgi:adenylate kinase family enzyme|nr:NACHT domain-containing protein [Anaerolineae bacterium]MBT7783498.1 NACHT domain-containing protein [Anaerolineae bacterium]